MLNKYRADKWHRELWRVRLAALKLADGNIKQLRSEIENAICGYRDVFGPAECPGYMKHSHKERTEDEMQKIIELDSKQYMDWLNR